MHWLVRPCTGRVIVENQFVNCVDAMTVSPGSGRVRWEVCRDSDPFSGDGYASHTQFAVWIEPVAPKKEADASTITTHNLIISGVAMVDRDGEEEIEEIDEPNDGGNEHRNELGAVDVLFWVLPIES